MMPPTVLAALLALRRNILRSALTTLGIVIGVGAVIAMAAIGRGSKASVAESIKSLGANNLLVMPGQASSGGVSMGGGSAPTLTPADVDVIRAEVPAAVAVSPLVRVRTQIVTSGKNWVPLYIYGVSSSYMQVRDWDVVEGRLFDEREGEGATGVCLLGQTTARELFGDESPIGSTVRLNNTPLQVVGVLERKGANTFGADQDDVLLAPWRTIKFRVSGQSAQTANQSSAQTTPNSTSRYPSRAPVLYPVPTDIQTANFPTPPPTTFVDQIVVRIEPSEEIPTAMERIREILRERHRIRDGRADDFNLRDTSEIAAAASATASLMSGLLLAVALISLVVGGVGIMNIMLVSVTERTKEIGLRMAVGARPKDILRQFLVEAVVLCVIGGILGVVLGMTGSYGVRYFLKWRSELSIPIMGIAVGVSGLVGVAFGFYPAWKASRLDPIEALRYE